MVLEKGIKFQVHSSAPVRALGGGSVAGGFSEFRITSGHGKESFGYGVANGAIGVGLGLGNLVLRSGFHGVERRRRGWVGGGARVFWAGGVFW